jgi:hypothetical protein
MTILVEDAGAQHATPGIFRTLLAIATLPGLMAAGFAQPAISRKAPPKSGAALYLHRQWEPREKAFTFLLPAGWQAEGGVVRLNPATGPTNSVGAKIDFALKKDTAGTVMIHFLPNYTYKDPRQAPTFRVGSNYMGSMVYPVLDPQTFMAQFVFRKHRPQAQHVQILERKPLPDLVKRFQQNAPPPGGISRTVYDAGSMTVVYDEGGVRYKEKMRAVIENIEGQGLGMWTNRDTVSVRAPAAEFDGVAPLFALLEGSLKGNPQWVGGERRGAATRSRNALETQRYLQHKREEILANKRRTNAGIRYSHWLEITGQEDYINPHTGEVEVGSNQWKNRWQSAHGDVVYSNDPNYDPNFDPKADHTDYKRSPVRQR